MARVRRPVLPWYLLLLLVALVPTVALILVWPSFAAVTRAVRAAALLGYSFVFFSVVSANYMQALVRRFGRPFVTLHHWASITGLVLITAHPVLLAVTGGGLAVFVPDVSSWQAFWIYAGRPAWFLLMLASVAAGLRTRFVNGWRIVHSLNYVAFVFGTVHATLIGTSFVLSPVARGVVYVLAAAAVAVFVRRRYEAWRRARRRRR